MNRTALVVFVSAFLYLISITNILAAGGCDALKTYVFNDTSRTTLKVIVSDSINLLKSPDANIGKYDDPRTVLISPTKLALIKTSHSDFFHGGIDALGLSRSFTYSDTEIWANDQKLITLEAKKPHTNGEEPFSPFVSSRGDIFSSQFSFSITKGNGSCEKGEPGYWVITVQDAPNLPSLETAQIIN